MTSSPIHISTTTLLGLCIPLLFACATPDSTLADRTKERAAILELHVAQQACHLNKDAKTFSSLFSKTYTQVSGGYSQEFDQEALEKRFGAYFESVNFDKWEDLREPTIVISDDGSLAYTIVEKEVITRSMNEDGDSIRTRTRFSWITTYIKEAGIWKIDAVASTNEPSETTLIEPNP